MNTQLLQNYSETEKTAYLSAIASLATADREASPAEGQFLQALTQQAGLSAESTQQVVGAANDASNQGIQQYLDVLKGSDLRFSLVTDLISFARADGAYANDEEAMIIKMSTYLGINPEQHQTLETVVDQANTAESLSYMVYCICTVKNSRWTAPNFSTKCPTHAGPKASASRCRPFCG